MTDNTKSRVVVGTSVIRAMTIRTHLYVFFSNLQCANKCAK